MKQAPQEKITVIVRGNEIVLDPNNMKFNETSLSAYLDHEYGWIDYFGKQLEFASEDCLNAEVEYDAVYSTAFVKAKDLGNPENYSKAQALSDPDVIAARKKWIALKAVVGKLKAHLKAWDKNHVNAQSRGHNLRQEMKALNQNTIYTPKEETCTSEEFFSGQ